MPKESEGYAMVDPPARISLRLCTARRPGRAARHGEDETCSMSMSFAGAEAASARAEAATAADFLKATTFGGSLLL